jgi:hypothetical protein
MASPKVDCGSLSELTFRKHSREEKIQQSGVKPEIFNRLFGRK